MMARGRALRPIVVSRSQFLSGFLEDADSFSGLGADAGQIAQSIVGGALSTASDVMNQITGKKTSAGIPIDIKHDLNLEKYIPWIIGGVGVVVAFMALRRK